jgi:cytochrome c-type biogenesis protein CcmF
MKFEGEHLLPGQLGHFFVLLAFVTSLVSAIAFFKGSFAVDVNEKNLWLKYARITFLPSLFQLLIHSHLVKPMAAQVLPIHQNF